MRLQLLLWLNNPFKSNCVIDNDDKSGLELGIGGHWESVVKENENNDHTDVKMAITSMMV